MFELSLHVSFRRAIQVLGLSIGVFLTCSPLFSQGNTGRILGTIVDQSGAVIAGATVTVTDVQRGISQSLTTDRSGAYLASNLTPSTYALRVQVSGFKIVERTGILLEVGQELKLDFTAQPGDQTQVVTVTESAPLIETTNATLGGTISNQTINDLPLNGRNFTNLLQLRPGIVVLPGGGAWSQSSNGVRPESNVYLIEGLTGIDNFSGQSVINSAPVGGDAATLLPIDSLQEFRTEQNPRAEFGWKPGAVVTAGLKSGTNGFHGTAYGFGRDSAWDARNYFNSAPLPKIATQLEQFGGTVGGPIVKDKLFFFGGFEGQLYTVGSTYFADAPFTDTTSGTATTNVLKACTALRTAGTPMSAVSLGLIGLNADCTAQSKFPGVFVVNTGAAGTSGRPNLFYPNLSTDSRERGGLAKLDYHAGNHHDFSGFYFLGQLDAIFNQVATELKPDWESLLHTRSQMGAGSWTWIPRPNLVNQLRVGLGRLYQPTYSIDHNVNPTTYGINTGITNPLVFGFPQVSLAGFSNYTLGKSWPKIQGPDNMLEISDSVSYVRGKHAFKFGGATILSWFTGAAFQNAKGNFTFGSSQANSLQNFLTGTVARGQLLSGDPIRQVSNQTYAGFFQDDWRVTPRLTLNLGVRYELFTVLKERYNRFGSFDPARGIVQVGNGISSAYNGDHNNFVPRLGIAWDVRGNGKTVIRAGGGIINEQLPYNTFLALGNLLGIGIVPTGAVIGPNGQTPGGNIAVGSISFPGSVLAQRWNASSVGGQTIFPTGVLNCNRTVTISGFAGSPCNVFFADPNLRSPYVSTWTVDIQRAITNNVSLQVAYIGNHGTKLVGITDTNQAPPGAGWTTSAIAACQASPSTSTCVPDSAAIASARPFNSQFPYLNYIYRLWNRDKSNYNGLQTTLTARDLHGLSFLGGYTYAHALDQSSRNWQGGVALNAYNPRQEYGSSSFDVRHRFTLSTTYAMPNKKSFAQLLGGWRLNSIIMLQTGTPWAPQDSQNDFSGTNEIGGVGFVGERWDFYGNRADFTATQNPIPFFSGASNPACVSKARSLAMLTTYGCFARGSSVLTPPAPGTYGNTSRNMFRGSNFGNWDLSVAKDWRFRERLTAQFRAEFFNVLNHPVFADPFQGGTTDPTNRGSFGCGCQTPDQSTQNPVLGSGGPRRIQLGLKFIF